MEEKPYKEKIVVCSWICEEGSTSSDCGNFDATSVLVEGRLQQCANHLHSISIIYLQLNKEEGDGDCTWNE